MSAPSVKDRIAMYLVGSLRGAWCTGMILILTAALALASVEDLPGPRPRAMGGAYVAIPDPDANVTLWNPAAVSLFHWREFIASYGKPQLGIKNVDMNNGFFSVVYPFGVFGNAGMYFDYFLTPDRFNTYAIGLNYAYKLFMPNYIAAGISFKFLATKYYDDWLHISSRDPLFIEYGYDKHNYGIDVGLAWNPPVRNLTWGLVARNLNRPNRALEEGVNDTYPLVIQTGVCYTHPFITGALDVETSSQQLSGDYPVIVHVGAEKRFFERLSLRAGFMDNLTNDEDEGLHMALPDEATLGFGLDVFTRESVQKVFDLYLGEDVFILNQLIFSVDYSFAYDLFAFKNNWGTHRIALRIRHETSKQTERSFMTRQELETALLKRREEIEMELIDEIERQQIGIFETELQRMEIEVEERLEEEMDELKQEEVDKREQLEAERAKLEDELKQLRESLSTLDIHTPRELQLQEEIRSLEETIREKNEVIQRSTRTNEALQHLLASLRYYFDGDYQRAKEECQTAITIAPYLALSWTRLGSIYLKLGDRDAAIDAWEKSLSIEPDNPDLREWLRRLQSAP
jgi:tetratricopeptide (TPR) repeat protein